MKCKVPAFSFSHRAIVLASMSAIVTSFMPSFAFADARVFSCTAVNTRVDHRVIAKILVYMDGAQRTVWFPLPSDNAEGYCISDTPSSLECGVERHDLEKAVARAWATGNANSLRVRLNDDKADYTIDCQGWK
jgi:hypothetical protein